MALEDHPTVSEFSDEHDRWWAIGPVAALVALSTLGALELLFLVVNIGLVVSFAVNGLPDGWCPRDVTCSDDFNVLAGLPQYLIPLAILGVGWLLVLLSLRGPKTVSRRPWRWTMSVAAVACPVVLFVWIFI